MRRASGVLRAASLAAVLVSATSWSEAYGAEFVGFGGNEAGESKAWPDARGSVAVEAGWGHTVALKWDGTVVAWGWNGRGQTDVPPGLTRVVAVAAGWSHTVALKTDGTVVAWGENYWGETDVPAGLTGVVAVAAGAYHTVALKSDGTVVAWGRAGRSLDVPAGLTGVVAVAAGDYQTVALKSDGTVVAWGDEYYSQPFVPAGLTGVAAVAAGAEHTVALKADGTVVAWGVNYWGETDVPAGLTGVEAVAAGAYHTVALKSDGTVVAWGDNAWGQTDVPAGLTGVVAVAAGDWHTVALKSDGTSVAWGWNGYGQTAMPEGLTGVMAVAASTSHTVALRSDGTVAAWGVNYDGVWDAPFVHGMTDVPEGLNEVVAVSAGAFHTVALESDGTVVAWGSNPFGATDVPLGLTGVVAVAAGWGYTVALKFDGTVVAWGDQPDVPLGLTGVVAVSSGYSHTVALRSDGTVVAWGSDYYGQTDVPAGLTGVVAVAAGARNTVALKSDGTVVAWGDNFYGQSDVPAGLTGVEAVAAGAYHTVALKSDGTLVAWGANASGQTDVPAGLTGVVAVAAGGYYTVALKEPPTSDATPPSIEPMISGLLGEDGWYTSHVKVSWSVSDPESPVDSASGCDPVEISTDTSGTTLTCSATSAGGVASRAVLIKADVTPPSITCGPQPTLSLLVPGTVSATLSDGTSGPAAEPLLASADVSIPGTRNASFGGSDLAGNSATASCPYVVLDGAVTPPGAGVTVQPVMASPPDPTNPTPVSITFDDVTSSGATQLYASTAGEPPPLGFRIGSPPTYYDVTTGASYDGYVQVCVSYPEGAYADEARLRLMHRWDPAVCGGRPPGIDPHFDYASAGWEDATNAGSPDTAGNLLCGTFTCLSPFVVAEPLEITGPVAPVAVQTTVTLSAPAGSEPEATWEFGDGTAAPATLTNGRWSGSHAYAAAGAYVVKLTLTGPTAVLGTAELQYVVVYDPSGGFVTGGGWINSPAGAYLADPSLAGKATFGFVSRYQKGATAPTGSAEFRFTMADLTFVSSSQDWLVVAGARAQFKGTGLVNGQGPYKFVLAAIDADANLNDAFRVDRFRIVIWSEESPYETVVVYDNALGSDGTTATTPIGGGAIVVRAN